MKFTSQWQAPCLVVVGGEVVEHDIVGDTPNLAARLQAMAEPDTVVTAASTRRLIGDIFRLRDLGRQVAKGFAEPVESRESYESLRGKETAQKRAHELLMDALRGVHCFFKDGAVEFEHLDPVLGIVAGADIVAEQAFAIGNGQDTAEKFEEGGFASAIGADKDNALATFDLKIEALIDQVLAVDLQRQRREVLAQDPVQASEVRVRVHRHALRRGDAEVFLQPPRE